MKFCVIGHARHGKDTFCDFFAELLGLTWMSSSYAAAETIVFPVLKHRYGYKTVDECFDDRSNHRPEWFELIQEYSEGDRARFSRELTSKYDIYCGLRNAAELKAAQHEGIYDLVIWVDASQRLPAEDGSSCTVTKDMADIIVDNNGTEEQFLFHIARLAKALKK